MFELKICLFTIVLLGCYLSLSAQISPDFNYNPKAGCDTLNVTFTDQSYVPDTSSITFVWNFGNGQFYTANHYYQRNPPVEHYSSPGLYSVSLTIEDQTKTYVVDVIANPNPYFQVFDTVVPGSSFNYIFKPAVNNNLPDTCFKWIFNTVDTVKGIHIYHKYDKAGLDTITLIVTDTATTRCNSSYTKQFTVYNQLVVPNFFTPNNDGIDDLFYVPTNGSTQFRLLVFSRSGVEIYKSESTVISWDGRQSSGVLAERGTYYYVIQTISGAINYTAKGFVMVIY